MKAFLFILALIFSIQSFAYTFDYTRLGSNDKERFNKRKDQAVSMLKILNSVDDESEGNKGVLISYDFGENIVSSDGVYRSGTSGAITDIAVVRQVTNTEGEYLYYCDYRVLSQNSGEVKITLDGCKSGAKPRPKL